LASGAAGNRGANVQDISGGYQISPARSAILYYGHAWGKGVIAQLYPKDSSRLPIFPRTNFPLPGKPSGET